MDYTFTGLKNYNKLSNATATFCIRLSLSIQYVYTNIGQFTLGLIAALILHRRKLWDRPFCWPSSCCLVIPGITQARSDASMLGAKEFGTLNRLVGFLGVDDFVDTHLPHALHCAGQLLEQLGLCHDPLLAGLEASPRNYQSATIDEAPTAGRCSRASGCR
ncbi:MAG: hypothetical protein R2911_29475 [Caldilineaceae bacterium]